MRHRPVLSIICALLLAGTAFVCSSSASGNPPTDPGEVLKALQKAGGPAGPIHNNRDDVTLLPLPPSVLQGGGTPPPEYGEGHGHAEIDRSDNSVDFFGLLTVISFGGSRDAENATAWWNAGPGAEFQQPFAVTCAHLMVTGDWVQQHGKAETLRLLHRAYASCQDAAGGSSLTPTEQPSENSPAGSEPTDMASPDSAQPDASAPAPSDTAESAPTASEDASEAVAAAQHRVLGRTYRVGHFTVKLTDAEVTDDGTGLKTYVAATVASQSSDTAVAEQRGVVVTLLKPSGEVAGRGALCVELFGGTSGDYDVTEDGGSPEWTSVKVSLSPTSPC